MEREEKVGLVGCGAEKMGWLRCAGLYCDETAQRQSKARCRGYGCAARDRPFHHAPGRHGLALCAGGPRGRPAADALRAGRVAGRQSALQKTTEQSCVKI